MLAIILNLSYSGTVSTFTAPGETYLVWHQQLELRSHFREN
jgi:hypothetical protein